jgi:hypothetical protein
MDNCPVLQTWITSRISQVVLTYSSRAGRLGNVHWMALVFFWATSLSNLKARLGLAIGLLSFFGMAHWIHWMMILVSDLDDRGT